MLESKSMIKTYQPSDKSGQLEVNEGGLSRRQALKWMGVVAAGVTMPMLSGCEDIAISAVKLAGRWPELNLQPITGEVTAKTPIWLRRLGRFGH